VGFLKDRLESEGLERGLAAVRDASVDVAYLVHVRMFSLENPESWEREGESVMRTIDAAVELGARLVYGTSGPAGSLSWEEAAEAFSTAVAAPLEHAESVGVRLLLENSNQLNHPYNFAYTVGDLVELADQCGIGICVELFHSWRERQLERTLEQGMPKVHLVQVSDYAAGIAAMGQRANLGDGIVPLRRLLEAFLRLGYDGLFDLEILGPRIDEEGAVMAMERGAAYLSSILRELEATREAIAPA
jgi:sugar phosphate isomerase/epimerase